MSFHRWLQKLCSALAPSRGQPSQDRRGSRGARAHRPSFDVLEDRCVPALYAVTDLGALGGYGASATDLNQAGQVVGLAHRPDGTHHAFLWDNGTMIDLGTLGGLFSAADGINDLGQVVGSASLSGGPTHAFLVTPEDGVWFRDSDLDGLNDLMIDLGTLNEHPVSVAVDINNAGQVIGGAGDRAFFWDAASGMTDLGVPAGFTYSGTADINEMGQVTVYAYDSVSGQNSAFLWDAGHGMTALDHGPGYTYAADVNDAGQVAGFQWNGSSGNDGIAFLWTPDSPNGLTGVTTYLGVLPSASNSYASAVNNAGQVVGYSDTVETVLVCDDYGGYEYCYYQDVYTPHAFLWDATGGMVDLESQLLPGSQATLEYPAAINDAGAIAVNGAGLAFLLTPVPPGTVTISIADAPTVTEGNTGTIEAAFTVTLSAASTEPVTVVFTTVDSSATAGSDYQFASDTLTFSPDETSKTITVVVNGDRVGEFTESFVVNLSGATGAIIARGQGVGTIVDDEPEISIVPSASQHEGNTGQTPLAFAVTLSSAYDASVTVDWSTVDVNTTAGVDYQPSSGTLTIPAGETEGMMTVLVKGDRIAEPNETFNLNLNSANGARITHGFSVATITDDEPRISITDVTKAEGKKGKTTLFTFNVKLSESYDQPVTVSFQTLNGTATTSNNDYVARTGTITFAAHETLKTITIEVKGDGKQEISETFYVDLFGNSSNSSFTKYRGLGTILNDD